RLSVFVCVLPQLWMDVAGGAMGLGLGALSLLWRPRSSRLRLVSRSVPGRVWLGRISRRIPRRRRRLSRQRRGWLSRCRRIPRRLRRWPRWFRRWPRWFRRWPRWFRRWPRWRAPLTDGRAWRVVVPLAYVDLL